jgi:uroporphyrinogen-III synthase
MHGERIAILESRAAQQVAALVTRHGGTPVSAPALAELPDADPATVRALIERHASEPPALAIFQTGVGTRALFETALELQLGRTLEALLSRTTVAARGPKPTAVLRGHGVRIDRSAKDPFTTTELLAAIADVPVDGRAVLVQRYGESNTALDSALRVRGATPVEIPTYRWALPDDTAPLVDLGRQLRADVVDAVVFTSAAQVRNLFAVVGASEGEDALRASLVRTRVVSIGPVCSEALRGAGLRVDSEAKPPKLGFLIAALESALAARPRR